VHAVVNLGHCRGVKAITHPSRSQLHGIPEVSWGNWLEHPLRDRELAKLLKPYGIRSRDVKIDGANHKGYYHEQFIES
jgi:hypothetical protein